MCIGACRSVSGGARVETREPARGERENFDGAPLLIVAAFAAAVAGMPFPVISGRLSANLLSHAVDVNVAGAALPLLNGDATNVQWILKLLLYTMSI